MDHNSPIFTLFDKALAALHAGELEGYTFDSPACNPLIDANVALTALVMSDGNVGHAAGLLGIRRMRLKDWIDTNPEVQMCLADMRSTKIDYVEEMQFRAAMGGDASSGRFILQTLGKDRGFVQRTEQTGKDGEPLNPPTLDYSKLSTEALKELQEAMGQE